MAGPMNRSGWDEPTKKGGGGMDPVTIGLTAAGGISNLLGGSAQRRAQKKMFDAERNDSQRQMGQDAAQFAAKLGFDRDTDKFGRAESVLDMQRQREADAAKRANTNALNPARRDLISALMARFTGGGGMQRGQGFAAMQGGTFNPAQLSSQSINARPDYGALETAAAQPYTKVANPMATEGKAALGQAEQEARARAEKQMQVKIAQFQMGQRDPKQYAAQLGFDPLDPANRDKWMQAFMAEDAEWNKLRTNSAEQTNRLGGGIESY